MNEFDKINILGTNINVKDTTARNNITNLTNELDNTITRVSDLQNQITLMSDRYYIFISDSYGDGYTPEGTIDNTYIKQIINKIKPKYALNLHKGGASFSNDANNFLTLLKNANVENKNKITDIVVLGGYNDNGYDLSQIMLGINYFFEYAKTNYPNALITLGNVGYSIHSNQVTNHVKVTNAYSFKSGTNGGVYLNNCENILHSTEYMSSDGFHPNQAGHDRLANYCYEALITGSCTPTLSNVQQILTSTTWTPKTNNTFILEQTNNMISFRINANTFTHSSSFSFKCDGDHYLLGTFKTSSIMGTEYFFTNTTVPAFFQLNDNSFVSLPLMISILDRGLYASSIVTTSNNYAVYNIKKIVIPSFTIVSATNMC